MKMKTTKLIIATMVAYFLFLGVLPVHAQDGGKYDNGIYEDYYTYKQYWDSGQIPSYVNWYNCLMPRLMLFYSGIISKNNGYELYY